ncbi:HNH endonuclease [Clostridium neuense]|uniref:HNH endonuclease n=1 Tax=Clostridium neuense TaxID=1728934 RepID=A0ABW8TFQ6_9CLOT
MYCNYCNKEIIDAKRPKGNTDYSKVYRSSEHIIQNAIGGRLESEKICCDRCNFHLEELIDKSFCDIFVPFISNINNFKKTNNSNNAPKCSGYAIYNEGNKNKMVFADVIKKSKVKKSNELIKIEKEAGTKNLDERIKNCLNEMRVAFKNFNLDNNYFKQGISKIAYNYAIYLGINIKNISNVCDVTLDSENKELISINFNTIVIPFVPGNAFDDFLELHTKFTLFHNLILFRYGKELWCYINLFNTFQFYVRLSDNYDDGENIRYKIYGQEFQYMQSNMNTNHNIYSDIIMEKAKEYTASGYKYVDTLSYNFYIKQNKLNNYFRIENPLRKFDKGEYEIIFYPWWIIQAKDKEEIIEYTTKKYIQLNQYLIKDNPTILDSELFSMSKEDREKFVELYLKSIKSS